MYQVNVGKQTHLSLDKISVLVSSHIMELAFHNLMKEVGYVDHILLLRVI